jgi:hypothetical protein
LISKDNCGGGQRICEKFAAKKMALVGHITEDINNKKQAWPDY